MSLMPTTRFAANETIFEEGLPADGAYFICSGQVEICKIRQDKKTVLARLGEDSVFGEMALIDSRPRSATVIAAEETWCYHHNQESFLEKMAHIDPSISALLEDFANVIRTNSKIEANVQEHKEASTELELEKFEDDRISPMRSKESILKDEELRNKVDQLDVFMREVFKSLMNAAYPYSESW